MVLVLVLGLALATARSGFLVLAIPKILELWRFLLLMDGVDEVTGGRY